MIIVCFGDSLTVGYQSPTVAVPYYRETPYGELLQQWLGTRGSVLVRGINGETTGEMLERFGRDVLEVTPHVVIILGGTNDLGANIHNAEIYENLVRLYERAVNASIRPIAVTVPSLRILNGYPDPQFLQSHLERRIELNGLLMNYCLTSGIPCIDLFSKTLEKGTSLLAVEYSNDGLHLSSEGYELLAHMSWEAIEHDRKRIQG